MNSGTMTRIVSLSAFSLLVGACTTTRNERPWIGQTENQAKGESVLFYPEQPNSKVALSNYLFPNDI